MIDQEALNGVVNMFLPAIRLHCQKSYKPFILGLSGLQGSGKSTWAKALSDCLTTQYGLSTRIISLDDFYLDYPELVAIREANPDNKLLQMRGQPGTHDEDLAREFFGEIGKDYSEAGSSTIPWPSYDKSLHNGQGGRVPAKDWEYVPKSKKMDVLIFEGWCLGFQPLTSKEIDEKWTRAKAFSSLKNQQTQTLADHELHHLLAINDNLQRYCSTFTGPRVFDGFLHLSTENLNNVYEWRLSQEKALREEKTGMTDDQVVQFVRGYMPAYELFLDRLQDENFFAGTKEGSQTAKHVQVVLSQDRKVLRVVELE